MIGEQKLKDHFKWISEHDWCWEFPETVYEKLWEAIDNDREGLELVLSSMDGKNLWEISSLFNDFVQKWPDREMKRFIASLNKKIIDAGYWPQNGREE